MEELNFLGFTINPTSLECWICHAALQPHSRRHGPHLYLCGADHLVCGSCLRAHESQCGGSLSPDCCRWLEEMASRILVECGCGVILPYCKLKDHQADCFTISSISPSAWRKCMLKKELLSCSVCGATVRPPIFKSYDRLVCTVCYNASTTKDDFFKYPELDYFFKCMTVTTQVPCFSPCDNVETNRAVVAENNIIIGTTNGKDPSKVGKTDKHVVEARPELKAGKRVAGASFKTFSSDKIENVATASGKKAGMEASGTAMYPLHCCKTIHLVRHAQGAHNVEGERDHSVYMKPEFFDAQVTPLGWSQVDCLREHVKRCGLAEKVELVISSPLMRTMQTAVGVFGGGENSTVGATTPLLMVENAGNSGRPAISSLGSPPFLAVETCRERLGVHPCDKRRSITEYRTLFPAIDFSLIESDEDALWKPDVRETYESLAARGMKFIDWLWTRQEKEIAVVTHSGLLLHTLGLYSKECHPTVRHEVSNFANCELRSLVLVDRSMLGSQDSSGCNYPGRIPAGLDLPSDVADKTH